MDRKARMQAIWDTIRDIPPGQVASYGQVAEIAGVPRGARQVGYALRQLPKDHDVPWHRVLQASGKIAFEKGSRGYRDQRKRLIGEGVVVVSAGEEYEGLRRRGSAEMANRAAGAAGDRKRRQRLGEHATGLDRATRPTGGHEDVAGLRMLGPATQRQR